MSKDQILQAKRMTDALYFINKGNDYYFFAKSEFGSLALEAFGEEFVERLEERQLDEGLMSFFRKFRLRPNSGSRIPSSLDGLREYVENMGFLTSEDPKTAMREFRAKGIMIGNRRPDVAEKKLLRVLVEYIEGEDVSKHEAVVEDIRKGIGQLINMPYSEAESDYIYYLIKLYDGVASAVEMSKKGITFKEINV